MAYSNETGQLVQELSYDAWGRRRNPADWAYYPALTDANAWHARGFTGQEHLDLFEMVNMNGRMYDPVLGRFMSADPYVQAPDYTQSLNRYAYCLNNPLSLLDPSGYSWFSKNWKSLVSATVGIVVTIASGGLGSIVLAGALGGAAAGLSGALLNGANFGQALKATFTGGVWGAAGSFLAFASGGGPFLERLFKHSFSQAWLEGIRGGNMKHGLMAGLASVAGGEAIMQYAGNTGKAVKVALNSVVAGTASELGGGKFANGAMTGAFSMLFNDLRHQEKERELIGAEKKLSEKISEALTLHRKRMISNQSLPYYETPSREISIDISVKDTKDFYSNVPIEIGDETIYADIYYTPSGDNVVKTIGWMKSEMISSINNSIRGYGLYMQNGSGVGYDVVKIIFPIKNPNINSDAYKGFTKLKNYLLGL